MKQTWGYLKFVVNMDENIKDSKHKLVEENVFCNFQLNSHQVCQVTYWFSLGIGKHRLKAIKV